MPNSSKLNMNLHADAQNALDSIQDRTGYNTTDAVNKALKLFDKVLDYAGKGPTVEVVTQEGGTILILIV